jgi:hypothetical protein
MTEASIRELKDVFTGELLVNGYWIVANVETTMAWPIEKQKFRFMNLDILGNSIDAGSLSRARDDAAQQC